MAATMEPAPVNHKLRMRGQTFVCVSCPGEHTVPLDPARFTIDTDGNVVRRKKDVLH